MIKKRQKIVVTISCDLIDSIIEFLPHAIQFYVNHRSRTRIGPTLSSAAKRILTMTARNRERIKQSVHTAATSISIDKAMISLYLSDETIATILTYIAQRGVSKFMSENLIAAFDDLSDVQFPIELQEKILVGYLKNCPSKKILNLVLKALQDRDVKSLMWVVFLHA